MGEPRFCPACGNPRSLSDVNCVRCGLQFNEGGAAANVSASEFTADQLVAASSPSVQPPRAADGEPMCVNHPEVPASARCAYCGVNVCPACDFLTTPPETSNRTLNIGWDMHACPKCAKQSVAHGAPSTVRQAPHPVSPLPGGVMCTQHPEVNAVRRCGLCTATMCATCDFELPGFFHLCPACVSNPHTGLSPRRKRMIGFAYALAAVATLIIGVLFSGALAGTVSTKEELEALYNVIGFLVFGSTVGGVALSFGAMDKRLGNPAVLWGAVIWNAMLLVVWVLLSIVGSLK